MFPNPSPILFPKRGNSHGLGDEGGRFVVNGGLDKRFGFVGGGQNGF